MHGIYYFHILYFVNYIVSEPVIASSGNKSGKNDATASSDTENMLEDSLDGSITVFPSNNVDAPDLIPLREEDLTASEKMWEPSDTLTDTLTSDKMLTETDLNDLSAIEGN